MVDSMKKRRDVLKIFMKTGTVLGIFFHPFLSAVKTVYATANKTIVPKDIEWWKLKSKDPSQLDTRNLEVQPLKDFRTMGITDHEVDIKEWRLEVRGDVRKPLQLTYAQVLKLPTVEREVLLICPGVFSNHGRWKGISMKALFDMAGADNDVERVVFSGANGGEYVKTEEYQAKHVISDQVFLAHTINGVPLPQKHGFPLRLVAEEYYGGEWVKYVFKIEFKKA
jgi:sulfoxide reductase catalytic subunit YedY